MPEFPDIQDAPEFTPPPELTVGWPWWATGLAWLVGISLLLYGWRCLHRRITAPGPPESPLAPSQLAVKLLEDLRCQVSYLPAKEAMQRVVQIIRTWLHRSFGILANYRTPEEILSLRQKEDQPPPPPILTTFQDFLLSTNALGYGAANSGESSINDVIDQAIEIIRQSSIARTA